MVNRMKGSGSIYVGIGGWNFEPWRGVFYPKGLPQAKELNHAATHLTSIEINSTFYGSQKPESFRKWARETPDGFVFSVKGPRFATNRRVLAEAGESIGRFLNSGVMELGDRLGPLLWQFAPHKKFDAADFGAFLALLPAKHDGRKLRHVIEVRHHSFLVPEFVALLRKHNMAPVFSEHETYPTRPATLFICACRKARTRSRPAIRRRSWTPGRSACAHWPTAACRRICPWSIRTMPRRRNRATCSPT
jgi:uncharacterized protein YecE (DUF72 family)